ncbi:MAG: T9SS type A sorting domain-containing protein, partial [candidate division Zixibacteria bacterium]|nr:T9SS type A sorting domain-containing protein [candidate division Zixibacteria bacterium]
VFVNRAPYVILGEITVNNERFAELLIFTRWVDSLGRVHTQDSVTITTSDFHSSPIERTDVLLSARTAISSPYRSATSGDIDYVIITNRALAPTLERLRKYKAACGYSARIMLIEDIANSYPGRDAAEQMRNYLKSYYAQGGRYVLLGGDASVVPVRYAYPYPTTTVPDLRDQLLCDLYFADLTGDWDSDSDGVWGERYDDRPDIVPELLVGRLPVDNADQVSAYIDKLIRYDASPGDADASYLGRTLFFSSDQMRDYSDGGQHGWIARAYPLGFGIDTVTAVEAITGSDPSPSNVGPRELPSRVAGGYGIVNVIAHGRYDGFVLKSSGYNNAPKQYVLAQEPSDIQCPFDSLSTVVTPAFYYSLACDNGGFDLDRPPFSSGTTGMSRALIGSSRGAVAFVANSRWGWVGSSYLLHRSFFDSLFAHPDRPAIAAMYESQAAYWYYRDLVYGQLFLGDPSLRVYASIPRRLTVDIRDSSGSGMARVTSNGDPVSGATIILSDSGTVVSTGISDADGRVVFGMELAMGREYAITAQAPGASIGYRLFTPSMNTGVDGEQEMVPLSFALLQNYPNPCNPSTVISFDLGAPGRTSIVIYNSLGQEVATVIDRFFAAGRHSVTWDGRNGMGTPTASGVYFYRLVTGEFSETKKLALIR